MDKGHFGSAFRIEYDRAQHPSATSSRKDEETKSGFVKRQNTGHNKQTVKGELGSKDRD